MNKNIPIIIAVIIGLVVLFGGGLLYLNNQNSKSTEMMTANKDKMMSDNSISNDATMDKDTAEGDKMMASASSNYIEYSPSALQGDSKNKVLFFYANWCPTCRPVDKEISQNTNKIPEGLTIIRVNYNDTETDQAEKDLAKKYNVTYQHTFVQIDENGNEIKKWNGGDLDQLLSNIN